MLNIKSNTRLIQINNLSHLTCETWKNSEIIIASKTHNASN